MMKVVRLLYRCVFRAQSLPVYRRIARRVGASATIRPARDADMAGCRRIIGRAAESDAGARRLYVAALGPIVLGAMPVNDVSGGEIDGWFVGFIEVRLAARGMGLAERLLREAERVARAEGATSLWGIAGYDNAPMMRLAAKFGLRPFATPALDERLREQERTLGVRRTYLRKELTVSGTDMVSSVSADAPASPA
jgi:GNAT superfamily N-acetyltransferase